MKIYPIYILNYLTVLDIISTVHGEDFCLDFSPLKFVQSDGLVLLTLFLHSRQVDRSHIKAILPEIQWAGQCPLTYMKRMHFFEKVENISYSSKDVAKLSELESLQEYHSQNFTPLLDLTDEYAIAANGDNLESLIDSFMIFLREYYGFTTKLVSLLKQLITETFTNLVQHAQPDKPTLPYYCSQIQRYPQRQGFSLAIGDLGIGIKNSLNTVHNFSSDLEALHAVVHRRVSRMSLQNEERGGGIRYIFDIAKNLSLGCRLRSGEGVISVNVHGNLTVDQGCGFPGTQLFVWK